MHLLNRAITTDCVAAAELYWLVQKFSADFAREILQMTIHSPFKVTVIHIILYICILQCLSLPCGDCPVQQVHSGNCQCHITSCKSKIRVGGIKKPSELLVASLGALQYRCTNGSCTTVALQNMRTHLSLCTGAPARFQKPTHRLTSHYRKS